MMFLVMTGNMAAAIDRAKLLAAAALEVYMVYTCARLGGPSMLASSEWWCPRHVPSQGNTEFERGLDVLCEEYHEDYREGIAEDHACERWGGPMRFGSA
jgi:hypothetical protein